MDEGSPAQRGSFGPQATDDTERLLVELMREIPARIWMKDAHGRYTFVNSKLISEIGIEREKWIGATDEELFPTVGQVYWRKDLQVLATGEVLVSTDQVEQGKYLFAVRFPLEIDGETHVAGVGVETTQHIAALIGIFHLRDELFRNERLRAIGEVASGLAHDLRNNLNAATLRLQALRAKVGEEFTPEIDALSKSIVAAADRIRGLQDFVRITPQAEFEAIDLKALIRDAVEMVDFLIQKTPTPNGASIKLECDVSEWLPIVRGPANELKHVICNLLMNARDAMADGGVLLLEARTAPSAVEVVVSDQGVGVPQDLLDKIFDPFFTTKELGNGLGLSMARDVMTRIGGEIRVANRIPNGAVFTLILPQTPDDSESQ